MEPQCSLHEYHIDFWLKKKKEGIGGWEEVPPGLAVQPFSRSKNIEQLPHARYCSGCWDHVTKVDKNLDLAGLTF